MGRLFVDSDVLIKAAHWELLDEIPGFAPCRWIDVSTNASLIFRARRCDTKLFKTAKAANDLYTCLKLTTELPKCDQEALEALQGFMGIDSGEALLLSALCADPTAIFLTGDKRAIKGLGSPDLDAIRGCIRGRVFCLEQFLLHVLKLRGAPYIAGRIQPFRVLDTAVHCAVGSSGPPSDASLRAGLESYLRDIQLDCRGLLGP